MLRFLTSKAMQVKAQSSMEFFVLMGLSFFAAAIFIAASVNEVKEFNDEKNFFLIRDVTLKLQKEATIAASVEEGYERSFELPDKLESRLDYYIITGNTSITVNSSKAVFSAAIPKVIGNFTKGSNKIENIGGAVYINRK